MPISALGGGLNLNLSNLGKTASQGGIIANINSGISRSATSSINNSFAQANRSNDLATGSVQNIFDKLYEKQSMAGLSLVDSLKNPDQNLFQDFITQFTASNHGGLKSLSEYDADKTINTIAAKYTAMQHAIETGDFTAKEKQDMQANLDRQLEQGFAYLEEKYGNAASELFNALGNKTAGKEAGTSLTELIKEQAKEFKDFLDSDEGKRYLSSQAKNFNVDGDAAPLDDSAITKILILHKAETIYQKEQEEAAKARALALHPENKDNKATQIDKTKDAPFEKNSLAKFSINDLKSLSGIQKGLNSFINQDLNKSEEQLGYEFGLGLVKSLDVMQKNNASDTLKDLVSRGFEDLIENKVSEHNKGLRSKQEKNEEFSEENQNKEAYKDLDMGKIKSVFNNVLNSYKATGNPLEAVTSGFDAAKIAFDNNFEANAKTMRYQMSQSFFAGFYQAPKQGSFPYQNNYESTLSPYHVFMNRMERNH